MRFKLAAQFLLLSFVTASLGQTTTRPALDLDLSTPQWALVSYIRAQQAFDLPAIQSTIATTDKRKSPYVDLVLNFRLWRHYLERQAIKKFGATEGIKVEGHMRSLDDQLALDRRRTSEATVELFHDMNAERAKIFLQKEPDRPEGLQSDRFDFLDTYWLIKTDKGGRSIS